jgi:hypothetical protein
MNKRAIEYKKALKKLTTSIIQFEIELGKEMLKPSTLERGRRIAILCNWLTMRNHAAMRFTLDYSWDKIRKLYSTLRKRGW